MLDKLLSLFRSKPRYNDEVAELQPDEYALLVSKKRIIDYSKIKEQLDLPIKIGMYMDTYKILRANVAPEVGTENIEKVLSAVNHAYQTLLKEKFAQINDGIGVRDGYTAKFDRTQQLFEVDNIKFFDINENNVFCVNLFTRPNNDSFIVIGREPKFKGQRPSRVDGAPLLKANNAANENNSGEKEAWEYIEFE